MGDLSGGGAGGRRWPAAGGGGGTLAAAGARRVPQPGAISGEAVRRAERAAREVLRRVQPTAESERRRHGVIQYARRLVGATLGCEVIAFGSVPLKTYLPDGDIDLTVLGSTAPDSTLISDVRCILESEEQSKDAEFQVQEVHYIHAEVRLIKCLIEENIVDISFNQIGGVSKLCFLELVDRHVGKNHLFKRSIMLIKAWCYYESRILGAHHGLISTYALEIMVLHIFNLFHKSLHGPLEVLYRFLEYFSKFDWDNYCISLHGPAALSSLPDLIVDNTDLHGDGLLLDREFFKGSEKLFASLRNSGESYTKLRLKHLNIIDPLKENNNLGRSVSKANFRRIRIAFSYGAQKLGQILMLPSELIPDVVYHFFMNTLARLGMGERPDTRNTSTACQPFLDPWEALRVDISNMKISSYIKEDENTSPQHPAPRLCCKESNGKANGHNNSCTFLSGNAWNNNIKCGKSTTKDHNVSSFHVEDGDGNSKPCSMDYTAEEEALHSGTETFHGDTRSFLQPQIYADNTSNVLTSSTRTNSLKFPTSDSSDDFDLTKRTICHVEKVQLPAFSSSSLADLSGDLELHLKCLRVVQYHLEFMFGGFLQSVREVSSAEMLDEDSFNISTLSIPLNTDIALPVCSSASSSDADGRTSCPASCSSSTDVSRHSQDEDQWDVTYQENIPLPAGTDGPSNGLSLSSSSAADSDNSSPGSHSSEDIPRMYGTGTFIPKMSYEAYTERMASPRARKQMPANQSLKVQKYSQGDSYPYKNSHERGTFGSHKEHVRPERATKQMPIMHSNSQQDVYPNKNFVPKGSSVPTKERLTPDSSTNQIPATQQTMFQSSLHPDHCSNNKLIQKQSYDTRKECVTAGCSTRQIPTYQPLKVQNSQQLDIYLNENLIEKLSYDYRKEHLTFEVAEKKAPRSEGLKSRNSLLGEASSNMDSRDKGSLLRLPSLEVRPFRGDDNGHGRLLVSNTHVSSIPSLKGYSEIKGSAMQPEECVVEFGSLGPVSLRPFSSEFNKKLDNLPSIQGRPDAPTSTLQSSMFDATQSRPHGFYQLRDEGEFPPLPPAGR